MEHKLGYLWVWDDEESQGFNFACAFEITLINFGIIAEDKDQDIDVIWKFDNKYGNGT